MAKGISRTVSVTAMAIGAHGAQSHAEPNAVQTNDAPPATRGVYGISVAAELLGLGPQTLRLYETRGLIDPQRTPGGTRRYSAADLDRVRRVGRLLEAGLNLAGIAMVLALEDANAEMQARLDVAPTSPVSGPAVRRRPARPTRSSPTG